MMASEKAKRGTCRVHEGGHHMAGSIACVDMSVRAALDAERARLVIALKAHAADVWAEDDAAGKAIHDAALLIESGGLD